MGLRFALRDALCASIAPLRRCYHEGIGNNRYTLATQSGRDAAQSPPTGSLSKFPLGPLLSLPRSRGPQNVAVPVGEAVRGILEPGRLDPPSSAPHTLFTDPRFSGILRCHELFVSEEVNERSPPDATHTP